MSFKLKEKSYYPDEIADVASAERSWAGHAEPAVSFKYINKQAEVVIVLSEF